MNALEKLKEIIDDFNGLDNEITAETLLSADLGISSLAFFEIISIIEDEFDITIADKDIPGFSSIGDLVNYIEKKTML